MGKRGRKPIPRVVQQCELCGERFWRLESEMARQAKDGKRFCCHAHFIEWERQQGAIRRMRPCCVCGVQCYRPNAKNPNRVLCSKKCEQDRIWIEKHGDAAGRLCDECGTRERRAATDKCSCQKRKPIDERTITERWLDAAKSQMRALMSRGQEAKKGWEWRAGRAIVLLKQRALEVQSIERTVDGSGSVALSAECRDIVRQQIGRMLDRRAERTEQQRWQEKCRSVTKNIGRRRARIHSRRINVSCR